MVGRKELGVWVGRPQTLFPWSMSEQSMLAREPCSWHSPCIQGRREGRNSVRCSLIKKPQRDVCLPEKGRLGGNPGCSLVSLFSEWQAPCPRTSWMRAGKERQSHSGREGGLGFSVLLPIRWKFLPEQPACDFVFPCLSNSSVAQYSFCFCLQPGFNPADLLLLLCHCWHGVLCWRGLPELLQVSTANPPPSAVALVHSQ